MVHNEDREIDRSITVGIEDGPDAIVAAVAARLDIPAGDVCG